MNAPLLAAAALLVPAFAAAEEFSARLPVDLAAHKRALADAAAPQEPPPVVPASPALEAAFRRAKPATVLLSFPSGNRCSGFAVDASRVGGLGLARVIVTAGHCVGNVGEAAEYRRYDAARDTVSDRAERATVLAAGDPRAGKDLAFLRPDGDAPPYLELREDEPAAGEEAGILGHPYVTFDPQNWQADGYVGLGQQVPFAVSAGVVEPPQRVRGAPTCKLRLRDGVGVWRGNSGGPMIDAAARVIGANFGVAETAAGERLPFAFGAPPSSILRGLEQYARTGTLATGVLPAPLVAGTTYVSEEPRSLGGALFRPWDDVVAVDGVRLESPSPRQALDDALRDRSPGERVTVRVSRRGTELDLRVMLERPR